MMSAEEYCFFSPHLDDVVFSCGGFLAKLRAENKRVTVFTCFNKQPKLEEIPKKMRVFADYSIRLEENQKALEYLDVHIVNLDFFERAFVKPYLPNLLSVFSAPPSGLNGYLDCPPLIDRISNLIKDYTSNNARFYFPLGVGNHVDHTRLFFAGIQVMERLGLNNSFYFYEDGYAMMGNRVRKKNPIAAQHLYPSNLDPGNISLKAFFLSYAVQFIIKQKSILPEYNALFEKYHWEIKTEPIHDFFDQKIKASLFYTSQLEELGGEKLMLSWIKQSYLLWNEGEPYWQALIPHNNK